ncbi:MAG: A1AO H+ ATPase subunit A [Candidatus Methanoperedens nitroreducens]|uniref:A-type ATP synthase subunit A n=1 Tax=Candidatus Methanoperedens nitratireducens TaxID=1392998 RepID=A0A0N8KR22_9EURY|nr:MULTISPECIES: ATP synthase subunit A [Methanoperedens]KAB2941328.1 MAG: ATP synthase subunit A [Candidatus Methanoperedens sp.]KPQ43730.1 MAG: A1AO H+ ATPase subunit A [Candidatus Methanoperedens sp. BLZ1]MBZ0173693.1 ATP synthase subunit A [Candidatus Methanoperedens nitroreducens]MCX9079572.1 ATP synthase subunit A [Candidatus Methanoperedens sp.]SNQ61950.1 V-type ATP synthase alpha chain [Candidatus Methanoperedens nitroreducens]
MKNKGEIYRISGPVVIITGLNTKMYDVVKVGNEGLMGEVIGIEGDKSTVQVYEETSGVRPGEPVENTGMSLSVELGPGLLESIYDGIQRPLPVLKEKMGDFIKRGVSANGLSREKEWDFVPTVKKGDKINGGDIIGTVRETLNIEHRILVPPTISGTISEIKKGKFKVDQVICTLEDGKELTMMQKWPVRKPRPVSKKMTPGTPLITGQRILDGLFPVAKGGTAAIPGPFGSGKTVTQQQLAKWSDTEIVVYIGCGERGNEMADVLYEFPEIKDPKTGRPLMERTVLIANTSNMPVAAREASVYTGITIAEYYRDMGYDVSLMADSTSRWAEAMREISSRLEEMPGEEGYPAYLAARLSEFYERAGKVKALSGKEGSITVIGAVSPPGGDFSEPITQNTLRIVKVFWALDAKLAQRRHFPSINWLNSYSLYTKALGPWYDEHVSPDWVKLRNDAMELLQKESELQEIVQLVGSDALPEDQQLTLEVARMIREYFLQQNAYHEVDTFCPMDKQFKLLKSIMSWGDKAHNALDGGAPIEDIMKLKSKDDLAKVKYEKEFDKALGVILKTMEDEFAKLRGK